MPVDLAPELLEILACPNCHSALAVDDEREELVCVASDCGLAYPVVDGIPVMLVDEARRPARPEDARRQPASDDAASSEAAAPPVGPGDADQSDPSATTDSES
jgi:hypothetical protein